MGRAGGWLIERIQPRACSARQVRVDESELRADRIIGVVALIGRDRSSSGARLMRRSWSVHEAEPFTRAPAERGSNPSW